MWVSVLRSLPSHQVWTWTARSIWDSRENLESSSCPSRTWQVWTTTAPHIVTSVDLPRVGTCVNDRLDRFIKSFVCNFLWAAVLRHSRSMQRFYVHCFYILVNVFLSLFSFPLVSVAALMMRIKITKTVRDVKSSLQPRPHGCHGLGLVQFSLESEKVQSKWTYNATKSSQDEWQNTSRNSIS